MEFLHQIARSRFAAASIVTRFLVFAILMATQTQQQSDNPGAYPGG